MTEDEVRQEVRRICEARGTQKAYADEIGVTAAYLHDFLNEKRGPGPSILKALGLRKVVRYEREET